MRQPTRAAGPAIHANRLLILEWLSPSEFQTGTELQRALLAADPTIDVELVTCASNQDVLDAIDKAAADVSKKGIPILHIEAHGFIPRKVCLGFAGPGATTADRILTWEELVQHLRELNIATRFNLAFTGAACASQSSILAADPKKPLPFVLAVTFTGLVPANALLGSLTSFYTDLLKHRRNLAQCHELANRHLGVSAKLALTSMVRLLRTAVKDVVDDLNPNGLGYSQNHYLRIAGCTALAGPLSIRAYKQAMAIATERGVRKVIDRMLASDRVPGVARRFNLQAANLVKEFQRGAVP